MFSDVQFGIKIIRPSWSRQFKYFPAKNIQIPGCALIKNIQILGCARLSYSPAVTNYDSYFKSGLRPEIHRETWLHHLQRPRATCRMAGSSQTLHLQVKSTLHEWFNRVSSIKWRVNVLIFHDTKTTIGTVQLLTNTPKHIALFLLRAVKDDDST